MWWSCHFYFVPTSLKLFTQYVVCLKFGFNVFTFAIISSDDFDHSIQKNSIFSRKKNFRFFVVIAFCHFRLLPIIPCINSRQNKFLNDTMIKVTIFFVSSWDDRKLFYAIFNTKKSEFICNIVADFQKKHQKPGHYKVIWTKMK